MNTPLLIAHRGASFDAPENTLSAFRIAWEQRAEGVECDVHLSKDGVLVCHHDANTLRQAGVDLKIADTDSITLKALDVGSYKDKKWEGEKIPRLSSLLETIVNGRSVFIEMKAGVEAVLPLREDLLASGVDLESVTVIAFDANVISNLKKEFPAVKAYWLEDFGDVRGTELDDGAIDHFIDKCEEIRADGMGVRNCSLVSRNFVDRLAGE